jgi:hypothetical protein
MISVIVYGRNDSHGYNLHKRAAISLNCIAEVLSDDCEIIFVDWNTPVGFPTFPEAIEDTLTTKCKRILRIVRVPEYVHDQYSSGITKKKTLEPIARNVALARSNPKNKWVLSTNTDMIFLDKGQLNFLDKISNLKDGYYGSARFSIPDGIWETFERSNPERILSDLKNLILTIDIEETIVAGRIQRFDAPGDFQLVPRDVLMNIRGFDEKMLKGWHVDSNLAKRLNLFFGETKDFSEDFGSYHCEHTRSLTHFTSSREQNDLYEFYENVKVPLANSENTNWGLSDLDLKEIRLNNLVNLKLKTLDSLTQKPIKKRSPVSTVLLPALALYPEAHALPYIIDCLDGVTSNYEIYYIGKNSTSFELIKSAVRDLHGLITKHIDIDALETSLDSVLIGDPTGRKLIFIHDFGFEDFSGLDKSQVTSLFNFDGYYLENINHLTRLLEFIAKNANLTDAMYIFINSESYGFGIGSSLEKFFELPPIAPNSRVRKGQVKKSFTARSPAAREKLFLKYADTAHSKTKKLDDSSKDMSFSSHEALSVFSKKPNAFLGSQGLMFNTGEFNLSIDKKFVSNYKYIVFEFDIPVNFQTFSNSLRIELKLINYSKQEANYVELLSSDLGSVSLVIENLESLDTELDFILKITTRDDEIDKNIPQVRLTNLCFSNTNPLTQSSITKVSDVILKPIFNHGWSYSNESNHRWAVLPNPRILLPTSNPAGKYLNLIIGGFKDFKSADVSDFKFEARHNINFDPASIVVKKINYTLSSFLLKLPLAVENTELEILLPDEFLKHDPGSISNWDFRKLFFSVDKMFYSKSVVKDFFVIFEISVKTVLKKLRKRTVLFVKKLKR